MRSTVRSLSLQIHRSLTPPFSTPPTSNPSLLHNHHPFPIPIHHHHHHITPTTTNSTDHEALNIQTLLKAPVEDIERRLDESRLSLSQDLILNVLTRHRSDWKPAYTFFCWVNSTGFSPGSSIYNEILDILGRMKRFGELRQVFDEMSRRKNLINERTYAVVVGRLAAAHDVDAAVGVFDKMEDFGLERNLAAFQTLLLSLCRYKHVEAAERLFRSIKSEFTDDIKTWNIVLNGWCVLRSLPDTKRVWKDILRSGCSPDKFTYGIFINSLTKSGKTTMAMNLLWTMWENERIPDVTICNTVIDGLCFKKRIPQALQIFGEMNQRGCPPNVATYNSLIKHLCKIQRMEKVYELLEEMEEKGESCLPNGLTYGYLLKAAKKPEEVDRILERMEKSGCKVEGDTYNLLLRLFMEWGDEERVKRIWDEMELSGLGSDQRTYTIVIHGLYDKGKLGAALECFAKMVSKGMEPESRTKLLVDDMHFKLK